MLTQMPHHERETRGYVLGLLSQAVHLATAFGLYAWLARVFGPERFGDWRLVLSVLSWFEIAVTAGVAKSLVMAASREPHRAQGLGKAAYVGQFALACVLLAVMQLIAAPLARALDTPSIEPLLRVASLDIPLFALLVAASALLLSTERYARQAIGWMVYAASKALLIGIFASGDLSVAGAFIGNALSSVVGWAALAAPLVTRDTLQTTLRWARSLVVAALPFLALALASGLNMTSDLWVLSALVSDRNQVGLFASAAILAEVPVFLFIGLNRVIFPTVARAHASGDFAARDMNTLIGIRVALVVSVMGVAVAAFGGGALMAFVFSAPYAAAALPLTWLMVAALGRTVLSVTCEVLTARDRMGLALTAMLLTGVAQVAAIVALAPRFGIAGAAAGAAVASIGGATATVIGLRDAVGISPLITLLRSSAVAALAAAPLALIHASPAGTVGVLAISSAAYGVLLLLTREVRPADIASLGLSLSGAKSRHDHPDEKATD